MSENINALGFEGQMTLLQAHKPQALADDTPVLSSAIDTSAYPGHRMMLIFNNTENGATTHTVACTVTESATSGGSYAAASTSGTLTALSADGIQWASIKKNAAKPFIKVTLTGSHADVDVICSASILMLGPGLSG